MDSTLPRQKLGHARLYPLALRLVIAQGRKLSMEKAYAELRRIGAAAGMQDIEISSFFVELTQFARDGERIPAYAVPLPDNSTVDDLKYRLGLVLKILENPESVDAEQRENATIAFKQFIQQLY